MTEDLHELSGAYAVDALDDVERARFERHLAECAACRAEVAGLTATAGELSALSELPPPAGLRAKVMADIGRVRPLPRPARRRPLIRGLVAASVAALLAVGGFIAWRAANPEPSRTVADQVLAAPDATRHTKRFPDGSTATIVRSPGLHKAVVVTSGMAAAPAGKVYQLWLQEPDGHFAPAGLMPPGPDQVVVLDGDASTATGAGITVEPSGGSSRPTSPPIALFPFT
jgi:anti-sigma factor RsiW